MACRNRPKMLMAAWEKRGGGEGKLRNRGSKPNKERNGIRNKNTGTTREKREPAAHKKVRVREE